MADTIREQIITSLLTRLATMLTTSGFCYNYGANVVRAKNTVFQEDLPACVLWPKPETSTDGYGFNVCTTTVRIEAVVEMGVLNPSVVSEKILGDIKKCVMDQTTAISAYIDEISYTGGGPIDSPGGENTITSAYAEFKIVYSETIGDPYSQ